MWRIEQLHVQSQQALAWIHGFRLLGLENHFQDIIDCYSKIEPYSAIKAHLLIGRKGKEGAVRINHHRHSHQDTLEVHEVDGCNHRRDRVC